jgi:hypothetical protein
MQSSDIELRRAATRPFLEVLPFNLIAGWVVVTGLYFVDLTPLPRPLLSVLGATLVAAVTSVLGVSGLLSPPVESDIGSGDVGAESGQNERGHFTGPQPWPVQQSSSAMFGSAVDLIGPVSIATEAAPGRRLTDQRDERQCSQCGGFNPRLDRAGGNTPCRTCGYHPLPGASRTSAEVAQFGPIDLVIVRSWLHNKEQR